METSKQFGRWCQAFLILVFALIATHDAGAQRTPRAAPEWSLNATVIDGVIEWTRAAGRAEARLNAGETAEIVLRTAQGMTADPVIAKNLKYEGAPRNDGFVLMPNEVEAYRVGDKAFEFKGTTGFMTTIDISSKDFTKK